MCNKKLKFFIKKLKFEKIVNLKFTFKKLLDKPILGIV